MWHHDLVVKTLEGASIIEIIVWKIFHAVESLLAVLVNEDLSITLAFRDVIVTQVTGGGRAATAVACTGTLKLVSGAVVVVT